MIPEIKVTCGDKRIFINSVTMEQYKKYVSLMEKNESDQVEDAIFYNKKIIQEMFGNRMSIEEIGEMNAIDFLTSAKKIHSVMQDIITPKLLTLVETEQVEREESAFDEYDIENGYEEEQQEDSLWKICGEIIERVIKITIRLLKESYSQCMQEDIMELLDYLKFELETIGENQM